MKRHRVQVALIFLVISVLFACRRDLATPEGVAEEFVDQHYVQINLSKAKEYTVGLAQKKLDDEIRLTAGQVIDSSTRKPRVHYKLVEKKETASRASYLYLATIQAEDAPEFTRRWLIFARKEGDNWRVSNFTEFD
jgi:hypothetical protein